MKITYLAPFILYSVITFGQNSNTKKKDIPGSFMLDFGVNIPTLTSTDFDTQLLGSRTLNLYYYYDIKLPGLLSHFNIIPGIGLGMDRFKFTTNKTLTFEGGNLIMDDLGLNIRKSQLITNYLDIPVDLRYDFNPKDRLRTAYISVGFKTGFLLNSLTKIKHTDDDGQVIKDKSKQDWNLNSVRYGITTKFGVGNFGLFGNYYLSSFFKNNSGPSENSINKITIGITLSGF